MVDLKSQYEKIKDEIHAAIDSVLVNTDFINGKQVKLFTQNLSEYLDGAFVVPCANGTDALQIALMALDLEPGDEVIVPAFTYVATAEVIALLGLKPKMVDVDLKTYNTTADLIKNQITDRTKVIVPVHLYGQTTDMEDIRNLAAERKIHIIEDNAQAIGAKYTFSDGSTEFAGCIGDIGTTSFFPSKNLGCFGDGGALFTRNEELANKIKMIANHGQSKKYHHKLIGCNSRLDSIQAAVLNVKLKYLNEYSAARNNVANIYNEYLSDVDGLILPKQAHYSTHVYHQFTMRVIDGKRDALKNYLSQYNIPSMIYYPLPLYKQEAFLPLIDKDFDLPNSELLSHEVLSLPIHTEMDKDTQIYIINKIKEFFND